MTLGKLRRKQFTYLLALAGILMITGALLPYVNQAPTVPEANNPDIENLITEEVLYDSMMHSKTELVEHVVKAGENLTMIVNSYSTTVNETIRLNDIEDPDLIYPGQVLLIRDGIMQRHEIASRSTPSSNQYKVIKIMGNITAYCSCAKCCGKSPSHPAYGITASGKRVKPFHTIAMDKRYPFGTQVKIHGYKPFEGITFTVEDRFGNATRPAGRIDVYFKSHAEALRFGRRKLPITIYISR